MSLSVVLKKEDETDDWCIYAFGTASETLGRVRLRKESGDIEILALDESPDAPGRSFYLAHVVPRLHNYHDRDAYPKQDRWTL